MKETNFKEWFKWADYGFENPELVKSRGGTAIPDDAGPINPIDGNIIMTELRKMPPLGIFHPRWTWQDVMEWGKDVGAIRIDISPLGSYKIIARRQIKDLIGEKAWICKNVFPLNENEHDDNEIPVAHEIYEHLEKISEENLDSPKANFPDFDRLVERMRATVTRTYPSYCMFPIFTKKMDENYYKFVFEFRGGGVEAPTRGRAEQFNIDLFWDKEKGLVRCWGYDIDSEIKQHSWKPQPSEWDEYYAPTQPMDEICDTVSKMFMTY